MDNQSVLTFQILSLVSFYNSVDFIAKIGWVLAQLFISQ